MEQIKRHQKRQAFIWKLLTYGLPGGGNIWIGFTGLGILYLFIFFCFVLKIIFWNGLIKDPFFFSYPVSVFKVIFFTFVFFFFYYVSIKQSRRKKEISDKTFVQILEVFRLRSQNEKDQIEGRAIISSPKEETPWP